MEDEFKASAIPSVPGTVIRVVLLCIVTGMLLGAVGLVNTFFLNKPLGIKEANSSSIELTLNPAAIMATDYIPLPPVRQEFFSPVRNYLFVLSTPDEWKSKQAIGELFQITEQTHKRLWIRSLPHEYGPRYVLVGNQGQVLLLDEWINVASRFAIMVLNCKNELVAQYDFDALQRFLNVPRAKFPEMARHGLWISSPPVLDASGERAKVRTVGKVLLINLNDGQLSLE